MPVIFISHGAPTMALDQNKRQEFKGWAEAMPKPSAILVISAHWETDGLMLGTVTSQKLIYDFGGFPPELYQIQYPAPGAPQLAERVKELFQSKIELDTRPLDRGWDHGVWTPLVHMYPDADIPLLQLSLPIEATPEQLFNLGIALSPLREEGVLMIGSGQITHNLRSIDNSPNASIPEWAQAFDDWCKEIVESRNWNDLLHYQKNAPKLKENHPTEEHFRPLLIVAGAASNDLETVHFPIEGFEFGSLGRRSIQFS